jgi:NADP-dependent 3-hydroxy acid dehydrogenase YdfG
LAGRDVDVVIEVGPDATLTALGPAITDRAVFIAAQRSAQPGAGRLLAALAEAHVHGARLSWPAILPPGQRVDLPTYAFQHQRYWPTLDPTPSAGAEGTGTAGEARFWAAVDDGDVPRVAGLLGISPGNGDDAGPDAGAGQAGLAGVLPALAAWRRREHDQAATASWRYQITWSPVPVTAPVRVPATDPGTAGGGLAGRWLIVAPDTGGMAQSLAADCAAVISGHGGRVTVLRAAPHELGRDTLAGRLRSVTDGTAGAPVAAAGQEADGHGESAANGGLAANGSGSGPGTGSGGPLAGVICLLAVPGPDAGPEADPGSEPGPGSGPDAADEAATRGTAVPAGTAGTLALIQALGDAGIAAPLWVLTSGAVQAGPGDTLTDPVQAQVWGLGRVAAMEHPDRWAGLIDLPPVLDERGAAGLAAVLAGTTGEYETAVRAGTVLARRLTRAAQPRDREPWQVSGTVLVTGGTGAIGTQVSRWAAQRGAGRLILASRSGPTAAGAGALAAGLAGTGATVTVAAADVADRSSARALLDWAEQDGPPVRAVFHTAGVLDDGILDRLDDSRLATVLEPKAGGAAILDELTRGRDLDAFVLFSSAATVFGGAGQGNYAAANAYLDALAEHRRARGQAGTSIAWGPWAGAGLAGGSAAVRDRLARGPLPPMDPALAIRALGQAVDAGERCIAVMDVNWEQFTASPGAGQVPLLRELPEVSQAGDGPDGTADAGRDDLAQRLAGLSRAAQIRALTELVRAEAAIVLGHASAESLEPQRAFRDLGFDSLTAVELRNRLSGATGQLLPSTLVFDYPTPHAIAEKLRALIAPQSETPAQPVLAELDKLESMLSAMTLANGDPDQITSRLESVMAAWKEARTRTGGGADVAAKLESSTDDEVFDFIGKELGIS